MPQPYAGTYIYFFFFFFLPSTLAFPTITYTRESAPGHPRTHSHSFGHLTSILYSFVHMLSIVTNFYYTFFSITNFTIINSLKKKINFIYIYFL